MPAVEPRVARRLRIGDAHALVEGEFPPRRNVVRHQPSGIQVARLLHRFPESDFVRPAPRGQHPFRPEHHPFPRTGRGIHRVQRAVRRTLDPGQIADATDAEAIGHERMPLAIPREDHRTARDLPLRLRDRAGPRGQGGLGLQHALGPGQGHEVRGGRARQPHEHRLHGLRRTRPPRQRVPGDPLPRHPRIPLRADAARVAAHLLRGIHAAHDPRGKHRPAPGTRADHPRALLVVRTEQHYPARIDDGGRGARRHVIDALHLAAVWIHHPKPVGAVHHDVAVPAPRQVRHPHGGGILGGHRAAGRPTAGCRATPRTACIAAEGDQRWRTVGRSPERHGRARRGALDLVHPGHPRPRPEPIVPPCLGRLPRRSAQEHVQVTVALAPGCRGNRRGRNRARWPARPRSHRPTADAPTRSAAHCPRGRDSTARRSRRPR